MNLKKLVVCVLTFFAGELSAETTHIIDRFQDDQTLNAFIQEIEEKTSRFTSDEFITSMEQKQLSFEHKKETWNNQPLYTFTHPLNENFSLGLYVNDLLKIGFLGLDLAYDWYFYYALKNYVADKVYTTLKNNTRPEGMRNDEYRETLCSAASTTIQLSYQEFQNPLFIMLLAKLSGAQAVLSYAKHGLLTNNQEKISWITLLTQKLTNTSTRLSKPIPIFDFINEHVLTQYAMNNSEGGIIESINQLFDSLGFIPSFVNYSITQHLETLVVNILFISWFNYYILAPMISTCVQTQFEHLEPLIACTSSIKEHLYTGGYRLTQTDDRLNNLEKKSEEALKTLIDQGLTLSFGTWLTLKNTMLARWKLYRNMIVSLPGWYRIVSGTYGVYKKIMIP